MEAGSGEKRSKRDNEKGVERKRMGGKDNIERKEDKDQKKKGKGKIQLPHTKPCLGIHAFSILLQHHGQGT